MVSRLSPECRLSLMAGGGEDASPLTGEPAAERDVTSAEAGTADPWVKPSLSSTFHYSDVSKVISVYLSVSSFY